MQTQQDSKHTQLQFLKVHIRLCQTLTAVALVTVTLTPVPCKTTAGRNSNYSEAKGHEQPSQMQHLNNNINIIASDDKTTTT